MPKKVLRGFLSLVIVAGIVLALWPLGQNVYAQWNQKQLQTEWNQKSEKSKATQPGKQKTKPPTSKPKSQAAPPKWPDTRLVIPDAETDVVVLNGWDDKTLRRAPSHMRGSANPGRPGNCVIAGHRNIYGSYFYKVDSLLAGAKIELRTPDMTYVYSVTNVVAVSETDSSVLQPPSAANAAPMLTLVTCTIPRTPNRVIVQAELETSP